MTSSHLLYSGAFRSISSWSMRERKEADHKIVSAHEDLVTDLIVLQKLDTLVSCSLDRTVVNWDTSTNRAIARYEGHRTGVFNLSYSPAYRLLFSVGFDHDACVWSPFVSGMVFRLKGHLHTLVGCAAAEDKPEVVTADASGVFKLWDVRNFSCVQTWQLHEVEDGEPTRKSVLTAFTYQSWASDDPTLPENHCRIIAASKTISTFDQMRVKKQSTSDNAAVHSIFWNDDKSSIITVSDANVIVWDALIGSIIYFSAGVGKDITTSCLDDRKRKIIVGTQTGDIHIVNPSNGMRMKSASRYYNKTTSPVCSLQYMAGKYRFLAGKIFVS